MLIIIIIINIIKRALLLCSCCIVYAANYLLNALQMRCDLPYPVKVGTIKRVYLFYTYILR